MTADLLALLESDPAAGILAVADLRERRANRAYPGPWIVDPDQFDPTPISPAPFLLMHEDGIIIATGIKHCDAEHIAAEANPAHALAAVRRWRGVVERHKPLEGSVGQGPWCNWCDAPATWPCPDLTETADEAKAYLGAPS